MELGTFCEMKELHGTHPQIDNQLKEQGGAFTFQSGLHTPHTACDQGIKHMVNKHSKSHGRTILR